MLIMPLLHLLSWWYSHGWSWVIKGINNRLNTIAEMFSVGTLLKTLFSPWKQIQSPTTFKTFLQSKIDNFISRFVGFGVRISMLFAALISTLVVAVSGVLFLIFWPIIPALLVALPIMFVVGIS